MLATLLLMTLVLTVGLGNLALGYGLAVHLGHGPAHGWQALMIWKKAKADAGHHAATEQHAPPTPTAHAKAH